MRLTTTGAPPALTALGALTGTLALALAACGGGGGGGTGGRGRPGAPVRRGLRRPRRRGRGGASVLAWPGYAEDGSTDPTVDWVTPFEQQTGCQVNVKTFATSDETVQLISTGEYDVVSASGDASLRLIYGGRSSR